MSYRVIYLDTALEDIAEIKLYRNEHSGTSWGKLIRMFKKSIKNLEMFPNIGTIYKNYRYLECDDYLIYYIVNERKRTVSVARFLHNRLDIMRGFIS